MLFSRLHMQLICFLLLTNILLFVHGVQQLSSISVSQKKLLFVAELCRHGDRSPLSEYPADSLPVSKWPEGPGQLTSIGMRAHYDLGRRLRERYVDTGFLSTSYNRNEMYVRSTDIERTLMSATSQLTGLYPPGTASNYDVRVQFGKDPLHENEGGLPHAFQPIPIHTVSYYTDDLLLVGNNCPRHSYLMKRKRESPKYKKFTTENAKFVEKVAKIVQASPKNFTVWDVERVSDTWTCFESHSVPLPKGATPEVVEQAKNISNWLLTYQNEGLEENRLRAGLLLFDATANIILSAMKETNRLPELYHQNVQKFVLYSAHDTTVAATLAALRVFDGKYPPYNSTLIWELYKDEENKMTVRIEYNGKAMILPGCESEYCDIESYYYSVMDRMIKGSINREIECFSSYHRYAAMLTGVFQKKKLNKKEQMLSDVLDLFSKKKESSSSSNGLVAGLVVIMMIFIAVIGMIRYRSRYYGYVAPEENDKSFTPPNDADVMSSRRILL